MGGDAAAGSVMVTARAYSIMVLAVFGVVVNLACIGILLRRRRNAIFHNLLKVWRRQRKRDRLLAVPFLHEFISQFFDQWGCREN